MRRTIGISLCAALLAGGCQTGDDTPAGGETTVVPTVLQEWAIVPDTDTVPAGTVTFEVTNTGEDVHELVIFRTDIDPGSLPTDDRGAVDEEGEGVELVDELEDVEPGASAELTVELSPGTYTLVCNIVHTGEDEHGEGHEPSGVEVHYALGMRTGFFVS